MSGIQEAIDKLNEAADNAKEQTRLAHEATRDLKATIKEALAVKDEIRQAAHAGINEAITEVIKDDLKGLAEEQQIAYKAILHSFEEYAKPLMAAFDQIQKRQDQMMMEFGLVRK